MRRRNAVLVVAVLLGVVPLAARADDPPADAGSALSASAEAYALRVEYDLPAPAGTGTLAHVSASASRSQSGELAHGIAAAPTELDAVVGGKYADPGGTGHAVNARPQTECTYPGDATTSVFRFPSDTNGSTASTPATSYAAATCRAGPDVVLDAHDVDPLGAGAANPAVPAALAAVSSHADIHPDHDQLGATVRAEASGISLAGGLVTIGSVTATGSSSTAGRPGTAASSADVVVDDIAVGGVRFSLAFSGSGSDSTVAVTIAGSTVPISSAAAQSVLAAATGALAPFGCAITIVTDPARYPQGFLFARPEPTIGVADDGSLAASYRGGVLVVCDVPDNPVAQATKFSPERFQALVGFAYTSVEAGSDAGGFGIGDLGGTAAGAGPELASPSALDGGSVPSPPAFAAPSATAAPNAELPVATVTAASGSSTSFLTRFLQPLDPVKRGILVLVCLAVWAALTHLAVTRLLPIGARDESEPS